jgi:hypothetical protein
VLFRKGRLAVDLLTVKRVVQVVYDWVYIQGVSGGIVIILGGGSMDYSE